MSCESQKLPLPPPAIATATAIATPITTTPQPPPLPPAPAALPLPPPPHMQSQWRILRPCLPSEHCRSTTGIFAKATARRTLTASGCCHGRSSFKLCLPPHVAALLKFQKPSYKLCWFIELLWQVTQFVYYMIQATICCRRWGLEPQAKALNSLDRMAISRDLSKVRSKAAFRHRHHMTCSLTGAPCAEDDDLLKLMSVEPLGKFRAAPYGSMGLSLMGRFIYEQKHLCTERKGRLQVTAFWGPEVALIGERDRNRTWNEINAHDVPLVLLVQTWTRLNEICQTSTITSNS